MNFNIKNKLNKYITIKNTSYLTFALNLTSIVLGIIYLVIPIYNIVWDILGVILIITLFTNLLLMFLNGCKLNMNMKLGRNLNLLSYIFIFINGLALILMALGNILISVTYSNDLFYNLGWYLMVYFGYFGLLSFGAFLAVFNIKNLKNDDLISSNKILVSNAATLIPFKLPVGILFNNFFVSGEGLNFRVGVPTINKFNPINCPGIP